MSGDSVVRTLNKARRIIAIAVQCRKCTRAPLLGDAARLMPAKKPKCTSLQVHMAAPDSHLNRRSAAYLPGLTMRESSSTPQVHRIALTPRNKRPRTPPHGAICLGRDQQAR